MKTGMYGSIMAMSHASGAAMSEDVTPRLRQVEKVLVDLVCRLDEILAYPNGFLERARALLGVGLRPTALLGTPFAWRHKAPVSEWVPVVGPSLSHHWLNWLTGTSKLQICREVVPSTGTPVPARDDFRGRGRSSAPDLSRRLLQAEHPVFLLNLASSARESASPLHLADLPLGVHF